MTSLRDATGGEVRYGVVPDDLPKQDRPREEPSARKETSHSVLIAEDEEPIALALVAVVEDLGYTPLVAAHGKQALELTRANRPRLVFTDLMMPYLDGANYIATVRKEAEAGPYPAPVFILMTAAGSQRAYAAGADAVLLKPFNLDEIERLLRQYLEQAPETDNTEGSQS